MANIRQSSKRLQIDKANTSMVMAVAIASFLAVFSIVAGKSLLSQRTYQSHVITKKEAARDQLKTNLDASKHLVDAYQLFISGSTNVIGGNSTGTADKDGNNAKIILDALPSKYDFPALVASLDKLLEEQGTVTVKGITGTDDEVGQLANKPSNKPQPIDMPFEINVSGSYQNLQDLIKQFEKSIRPFNINNLTITGNSKELQLDMKAKSYYQPEKTLSITTEVVK